MDFALNLRADLVFYGLVFMLQYLTVEIIETIMLPINIYLFKKDEGPK